ncbi:6f9f5125-1199-4c5f-9bca-e7295261dc74 [Thermothielavioides terrestris]|uniref:6f9f5125-1199-4c5f-9bca-e7295261dc74 n=2 Tax=Thermothielavioides terrestris TaxID=2587410 RepID=A0A446BWK6_9PEZI|nr:6f9f5125-1199-4c5f-9bca-e7295261dc74 [Thermothielavioides terrestris]
MLAPAPRVPRPSFVFVQHGAVISDTTNPASRASAVALTPAHHDTPLSLAGDTTAAGPAGNVGSDYEASRQTSVTELSTAWDSTLLGFPDFEVPVASSAPSVTEPVWHSLISPASRAEYGSKTASGTPAVSLQQTRFTPTGATGDVPPATTPDDALQLRGPVSDAPGIVSDGMSGATDGPTGPDQPEDDQASGTDTASRAVRQLSDLVVELYDFSRSIPPVTAWKQPGTKIRSVDGKELELDRILKLSHLFLGTLSELLHPLLAPRINGNESDGSDGDAAPTLDQPSELLVLSGYLRIIEIYHSILEHIVACAEHRKRQASRPGWHTAIPLSLPSLTVGKYTMQSTSATQVLVLVHLVESTLTQSHHMIEAMVRARHGDCDGSAVNSPLDPGAAAPLPPAAEVYHRPLSVAEVTLKGLRPKEEAALQLARTVRKIVAGFGYE